jgi:hypothetical protein
VDTKDVGADRTDPLDAAVGQRELDVDRRVPAIPNSNEPRTGNGSPGNQVVFASALKQNTVVINRGCPQYRASFDEHRRPGDCHDGDAAQRGIYLRAVRYSCRDGHGAQADDDYLIQRPAHERRWRRRHLLRHVFDDSRKRLFAAVNLELQRAEDGSVRIQELQPLGKWAHAKGLHRFPRNAAGWGVPRNFAEPARLDRKYVSNEFDRQAQAETSKRERREYRQPVQPLCS